MNKRAEHDSLFDLPEQALEPERAAIVTQIIETTVDAQASAPAAASRAAAGGKDADGGEMQPTALVFLDNPVARKLAVAWSLMPDDDTDEHWLQLAGLEHSTSAVRICKALKAHRICRAGGVTDRLALRYIATLVAIPLTKTSRRKPSASEGSNQ